MKFTAILLLALFAAGLGAADCRADKLALEKQINELARAGKHVECLPLRRKILALPLTDAERAVELSRLAALYTHAIRDSANGKKTNRELIALYRKMMDGQPLARRIQLAENIMRTYRFQMRENDNARKACAEVIALRREAMKTASPPERLAQCSGIQNACRAVDMIAEADAAAEELAAAWQVRLAECDALSPAEWLKQADPENAVRQLASLPGGYADARRVADRVCADPDAPRKLKDGISRHMYGVNSQRGVHRPTDRLADLKRLVVLNPESGRWALTFGELLFRQEHRLDDARKVFVSVRDGASYDAESRRKAELWLDMLADD